MVYLHVLTSGNRIYYLYIAMGGLASAISCTSPKPREEGVLSIISEPVGSGKFFAGIKAITEKADTARYDDCYFYVYKNTGVDIRITKSDSVEAVFFFAEGADAHHAYTDSLPYGIRLTDTRKEIEAKLGPPDSRGGDGIIPFYSSWAGKNIAITYSDTSRTDPNNRVHHICFSSPIVNSILDSVKFQF